MCLVYKFKCDLCDAGHVGFTRCHRHQCVDEHRSSSSSIGIAINIFWLQKISLRIINIYNCRQCCYGLLGLISEVSMSGMEVKFKLYTRFQKHCYFRKVSYIYNYAFSALAFSFFGQQQKRHKCISKKNFH